MIEVTFGGKKYPIYTEAEANLRGIRYEGDWRSGVEGAWVRTDTGYVLQILRRGSAGETPWIRTACGTFPARLCDELDHRERPNKYSLFGTPHRFSVTERIRRFAQLYARTGDRKGSYRLCFPRATSDRYVAERSRFLLGLPQVKTIVDAEITEFCKKIGVSKEWAFTEAKEIYELLKKSSSAIEAMSLRFRIVKWFAAYLQGQEIDDEFTETVTFNLTAEQQEALKRGEKHTPKEHTVRVRRVVKGRAEVVPGGDEAGNGSGGDSDSRVP